MRQKGFAPILIILLILVAIGGAYYFGTKKGSILPIPIQTPSANPTASPSGALPAGWKYQSDACNVRFPIPPKEAPYYIPYDPNKTSNITSEENSGRFWNFPRGGAYPNLLSKFLSGNQEYKQASAMYASEQEASGYISEAVIVSCFNNFGKIDNQVMLNTLKSKLDKYNQSTEEKGMQANKYTILSSKNVNRWGMNVVDLAVSEIFENPGSQPSNNTVSYTMFTTPQYIYEVRIFGMTNDSFVKETGQKIFNGLLFE